MFIVRLFVHLLMGIALACGISSASMAAGKSSAITPSQQLLALGDEFYLAMARFDPIANATFQGDSRFDDQLNINIDPVQRNKYFAQLHQLQKRLNAIKRD